MRTTALSLLAVVGVTLQVSAQPLRPTGSMRVARAGHVAVLMHDGRVLVVGGSALDESCRLPSVAELFDASTGTWSVTSEVPIAAGTGLVALSLREGRVRVSVSPGCGREAPQAFMYDPATNTWAATEPDRSVPVEVVDAEKAPVAGLPPVARTGYTATRLRNGAVLVAGGRDSAGRTRSADLYVPDIPYESARVVGGHPGNFMGKPWGIATDSRGHGLMSECSPPPVNCRRTRLFEWAPPSEPIANGGVRYRFRTSIKELEDEADGMAHAVRVDRDGNIWAIHQDPNAVVKLSPDGHVLQRFFTPADVSDDVRKAPLPLPPEYVFGRPTDVAWDATGNWFVSDAGKARVVKYAADGHYLTAIGSSGAAPGQLANPHSIAADAAGNVYVADHGNARIQVFDNNLTLRGVYDGIGRPWAICITPGPHQYLYSSSNVETDLEHGMDLVGEVYKMELDGTIVGRFGRADDSQGVFQTLHAIDCTQPNQIAAVGGGVNAFVIRILP